MNEAIRDEYKNHVIRIIQDEMAQDPRKEFDHAGKMLCFHRRYDLGDPHDCKSGDFNSWNEVRDHIVKELDGAIILPLFLYDHSGLRMKIGSFQGLLPQGHAELDSGQVGFIYLTRAALRKEFRGDREKGEACLRSEVDEYDDYLSGNVWGYIIDTPDDRHVDSCWGYYGDPDGYVLQSAKEIIDAIGEVVAV